MLLSAISGAVFADYYEVINDTLANPTLYGGVYANEKYILVGEGGSIYYSINATQWTKQPIVTNNTLNDIIYANDRFVIVGDNGTILTSFDGENWAERSSGVSSDLNAIMYVEEKYIVVGNNGTVLSSSDTGVWDLKTTNTNYNLNDIIFAKNTYIAVGNYGTIISSVNGNSWSILTSNTIENLYTVATDESLSASAENSRIVVGGANGTVLMSLNADSWAVQISPTAGTAIMGMTFYNSQFVLVGTSSLIMTSTDGVSWTSKFSQGVNDWYSVHYLNNKYFCLGSGCSVEYSSDGNSWSICNVTYLTLMKATIGEAIGINGGSDEIDLLQRKIDALNKRMISLATESVQKNTSFEENEAEYKDISEQIAQLGSRINAITESLARDNSRKDRLQRIQEIIAQRRIDSDTYDDAIVRQMIECIEVFKDGTLLIHFGGGYEIEEHI